MRKEISRLLLAGAVGVGGCAPLLTVDKPIGHKVERFEPTMRPTPVGDEGPIHLTDEEVKEMLRGGGAWTIIGGGPDGVKIVSPKPETQEATPSPSPSLSPSPQPQPN